MPAADTHRAIDAVWRIESARLIAGLARMVRDLATAEVLAHDALVAALEQWPIEGIPRNPDWERIVTLYDALSLLTPSPVVALNRAVAIPMACGPAVAPPLVEQLSTDPTLKHYYLLSSVRGDLLERLGRYGEAADAFDEAAIRAGTRPEQDLLAGRAADCRDLDVERAEDTV